MSMSTQPGNDPIGDFQRWLMKAGARSVSREVADKVKSTIGGAGSAKSSGVWDTATTEPPGDEPPECQWCPVCRAARKYRESGGTNAGLSSQIAGVGDTLAGLAQDAFGLFEAAMRTQQRPDRGSSDQGRADHDPAGHNPSDHGTVVGPGVAWPTVVHPEHEHGETADEGGDGEKRGEPGDGPADGGGDQQVTGPAEEE
jgi:hypothetical protein